ncbi:hypothetical protein [Kaarinaea lacus]
MRVNVKGIASIAKGSWVTLLEHEQEQEDEAGLDCPGLLRI